MPPFPPVFAPGGFPTAAPTLPGAVLPGQPPSSPPAAGAIAPNELLLKIRQGVAAQDKEGVRAALKLAQEANIPIEGHVKNMLGQWLQEAPGAAGTAPAAASAGGAPPSAAFMAPLSVIPGTAPGIGFDFPPPPPPAPESPPEPEKSPEPQGPPSPMPSSLPVDRLPISAKSGSVASVLVAIKEVPRRQRGPVLPKGAPPPAESVVMSKPVLRTAAPELAAAAAKPEPAEPDLDDLFSSFLTEVDTVGATSSTAGRPAEDPAKLVAQLKSKDWQVRHDALNALSALGAAAAPHVSALADCLGDRDAAVRTAARKALETVKAAAEAAASAAEEEKRVAKKAKNKARGAEAAGGATTAAATDVPASGGGDEEVEDQQEDRKARIQAMRRQQRRQQNSSSDEDEEAASPPPKRPKSDDGPPGPPKPVVPGKIEPPKAKEKDDEEDEPPKAPVKESWEYLKKDTFGGGNFFSFDKF